MKTSAAESGSGSATAPQVEPKPVPRVLLGQLLSLTLVTGVVDAVSILALGRVFVANMTGNVVFTAFSWAHASGYSALVSGVAVAAFMVGAVAGGELAARSRAEKEVLLGTAAGLSAAMIAVAAVVGAVEGTPWTRSQAWALVVLLGIAMGTQNAAARSLAVPDVTTTVLTLTITGLAADTRLRTGRNPRVGRRLASVAAMLCGGLAGAALVQRGFAVAALVCAAAVCAAVAVSGWWVSRK